MRWASIRNVASVAALIAAMGFSALAQQPPFPVTLQKQLADRAANYTEVSLDRKMLAFATHFLNDKDNADAKRIVEKLNGVYVRSYEFDQPGQYTAADLDAIRRQFDTSQWTAMVKTRSKNGSDDADIYLKMVNDEVQGMFVLDAESKELTFVYISGPIHPEDLRDLSGNFGIPAGTYEFSVKEKEKGQKKAESKAQKSETKTQKEGQP
ncbi:MAG TPA: DUF4252 domain-containing protein [Acidobacteriaceae bacterium]|nr:DUF4252 domain-containing protein [Acidobacteriaceae bacterium]